MSDKNTAFADFSNVEWGVNLTDDMIQVRDRQVQDCLNCTLTKDGVKRRPGSKAGNISLTTNARGIHVYSQLDGTETKLLVSNGKLYSTPTDINSKTELYDMTGAGKAYFTDYLDNCWLTNGTAMVKVEDTVAYQIGITPPSGVAAAAAAGGTMPDGTYTVYACYARLVGGLNKLFSVGENLGPVVLSGGNNTIAITSFDNSTDPQVGNKVIFLTIPAGSTPFFYETGDNTTESFNITSEDDRNNSTLYGAVAEGNTIPSTFEYIYAFNKSIYGSNGNTLYKSIKDTDNVYNMERFVYSIVLPYQIKGIFSLDKQLYLNTTGGIILLPHGDINSEWDRKTDDYFLEMNTVIEIPNKRILGLTYQTMRIFDGEKFLQFDIGADVRPKLTKIYKSTSGFSPNAVLVRTQRRLEYHLCYCDDTLSTTSNNERLVLNIDAIQFLPNNEIISPWEIWSNSANYMTVDLDQTMYNLQDHTTPKLYKFDTNNTIDDGIYQRDGELGISTSLVYAQITSRAFMVNQWTEVYWNIIHFMAKYVKAGTLTLYVRETEVTGYSHAADVGQSKWGTFVWGVDTWAGSSYQNQHIKGDENVRAVMIYIKFEQTANDKNFHILNLVAQGQKELSTYTEGGE